MYHSRLNPQRPPMTLNKTIKAYITYIFDTLVKNNKKVSTNMSNFIKIEYKKMLQIMRSYTPTEKKTVELYI